MKGKFLFSFKVFFSALFISLTCSASAYAEYYIASPEVGMECFSSCSNCCRPCYHDMRFVSPHRRNNSGTGQVEEYAWIGDP